MCQQKMSSFKEIHNNNKKIIPECPNLPIMKYKGFLFKLKQKERDLYVPGSIRESKRKYLFNASGDKLYKTLTDRLCSPCAEN